MPNQKFNRAAKAQFQHITQHADEHCNCERVHSFYHADRHASQCPVAIAHTLLALARPAPNAQRPKPKSKFRERTNADRVRDLRKIFRTHYNLTRSEPCDTPVVDILADLRHFCDAHQLDFATCDRRGRNHYLAELSETRASIPSPRAQRPTPNA
ncbi:MAG: hypothetical protein KGL39_45360 [Patescibacteria group bacterium]|nr:hypothetical protein [Patescibacteria group bacterium]